MLLSLLLTRLLPYAAWLRWGGGRDAGRVPDIWILDTTDSPCLRVSGDVVGVLNEHAHQILLDASQAQQSLTVDLSAARVLGGCFWAQLLLLRQRLALAGHSLRLEGVSQALQQQIRWNGVEDLLESQTSASAQ